MYLTDLFPSFETDHENKTIDYLLNLLQTNFANTVDREVYLRIELWHLFNNSRRSISTGISRRIKRLFTRLFRINHTTNFQHYSIHFKPNLEQLISIFHPNNDSEKLYKAEMHRQLAQFSEAELLLRDIVSIENKGLLKAIKKANKHKEHEVFRL
ncbi:MAG: hypothetical protein B7C24_02255 [Bacteroidetes bacterium 4572_77]|nr:MAG: hypothetical protein B7C24_02255 [Bacteroidetes bacterium 4572_77]